MRLRKPLLYVIPFFLFLTNAWGAAAPSCPPSMTARIPASFNAQARAPSPRCRTPGRDREFFMEPCAATVVIAVALHRRQSVAG